jgi:hypothetical protein
LRFWLNTLLRLAWGMYFVLTSLYCILAFLPYTFCAFIKAPPYPWMPWLVHHQAGLYWVASAAAVMSNWRLQESWSRKDKVFLAGLALLASAGIYLSFQPFLSALESNRAAYAWSLAALFALGALTPWQSSGVPKQDVHDPEALVKDEPDPGSEMAGLGLFGYSSGLLIAIVVSLIYLAEARMRVYGETHVLAFHSTDVEFAMWSLVSHCVLAIAVLSALNLIFLVAARPPRPRTLRRGLTGALTVVALYTVMVRFLDSAMSFDGWGARVYAASLALTLTLWGFSLVLPFLSRQRSKAAADAARIALFSGHNFLHNFGTWIAIVTLAALALASRSLIGGEDWNGIAGSTWALVFWVAMSVCVTRLRPARAEYSAALVVGTLLISAFVYKGLQATEIFWGKPLGSTDDEISLKFEEYGERDASFQLAHYALGNGRPQNCGDLCRILREYTNIRDTHIRAGVQLVDELTMVQGERPNVFIFVIDSMRPDYLGAYNPEHVNYTPNLDALARDSIVFRNVYTQYAGTSLSEPAIWAGAMLLHAHYPQPFDKIDSLAKLARADHYRMVASTDEMLSQVLPPADDVTLLDTDKKLWNQLEICSTVQQSEHFLDAYAGGPVFLYTQPKNVHQFARNDVPSPTSQHWQGSAGLQPRITYEVHWVDSCLGGFFSYLKQRGMYDNSIIIVTSDHGDATGEFGRYSHSTSIWPEIMHVPLIVHVPAKMREHLVYDDSRISTLTDIVPTLYYLLGHRPIRQNPLYGRPLLAKTKQELDAYPKRDLLLASDVRAVYGILTADGRYLYVTYDSPAQSYFFDLRTDPNAEHNGLTPALKQQYDEEIIEHLHSIADYYGFKPGMGSLLASAGH